MDDSLVRDFAFRRQRVAHDMRRRLVAHLAAAGTTDMADAPLENDRAAYVDPVRAEREKRELFQRQPLVAGLSADLPQPGDGLLFEETGQPSLVIRGEDGRLRAFLNMCTHRGSKLVHGREDGTCHLGTRLTCPFHAWTFDLDGRVVGVPGREGFEELGLDSRRLIPVGVEEWGGIVFVRPSPTGGAGGIPEYLGGFASELEQLELHKLARIRSSRLTAEADWKLALDTYCEGYHFGALHRSTVGDSYCSNVAVFDDFAPHWRLGFADKRLKSLVGMPEAEWPDVEYSGIHFVFPNTVLVVGSLGGGEMCVRLFRLFPGPRPGTMSCCISVYAPPSVARDEGRVRREFPFDDGESEITKEDYRVAVESQRNLESAPEGFKVVYGRNEPALQAVHRAIHSRIGTARAR